MVAVHAAHIGHGRQWIKRRVNLSAGGCQHNPVPGMAVTVNHTVFDAAQHVVGSFVGCGEIRRPFLAQGGQVIRRKIMDIGARVPVHLRHRFLGGPPPVRVKALYTLSSSDHVLLQCGAVNRICCGRATCGPGKVGRDSVTGQLVVTGAAPQAAVKLDGILRVWRRAASTGRVVYSA